MAISQNLTLLRHIISELRHTSSKPLKDNLTLRYIINQFRKYQTTDQQICKAQEEMKYVASTYLCYLRSSRLHNEINAEFHGKGERTVEQTANMVGFKLPHDPK